MAKTKINIQTVSSLTANSKGEKNNVANIGAAVNNIRWSTDGRILGRDGNGWSFSTIQGSISDISYDLGRIFQTIESATNQYIQTENKIVRDGTAIGLITPKNKSAVLPSANRALFDRVNYRNKFGVIGAAVPASTIAAGTVVKGTSEQKIEKKPSWFGEFLKPFGESFLDTVADGVGEMGMVGKGADGLYDLITGLASGDQTKSAKATFGILKPANSIIGEFAETAFKDSSEVNWKEILLGKWETSALDEIDKMKVDTNASSAFSAGWKDEWAKFSFKNADTVGDKIKVGTKYVGTALSFVTNGIDNQKEHIDGKISKERAVAETVVETAWDIVIGATASATATAAVGAAATALGVAAPAVAIGVAAVGITWAADSLTKVITKAVTGEEKGLTETVSDITIDIAVGVGKGIKSIGNDISNAIGNIGANWRSCFG